MCADVLRRQTADGHAVGAFRRADHLSVPADAGGVHSAWRDDGGGRPAAAEVRGENVSVRMICIKAPRVLRGLIRLIAGKGT